MKSKRMKSVAINILLVIIMQIALSVLIPIKAIAAEEIVTIQCNDVNFYNKLIKILEDKVQSKDDTSKTINITKTNVESVTRIIMYGNGLNADKKIKDITGIEKFTNLTELSLKYNQISEIRAISELTNLRNLDLSSNPIRNISELSGLTNLTELYLYSNQISDISELSGLTNLKILKLSSNKISDISVLAGMTNLTNLEMLFNKISDISAISELKKLTDLTLGYNQIGDISAISELKNLTRLDLDNNQISDISAISGLTKLTTLDLKNQTIEKTVGKEETQEIELPEIIKVAKDSNSKIYTEKDYILTNCTLSSDGTKVIVDTDKVEKASIKIDGGKADGTICTFTVDTIPPEIEVKNSITTPTNQNVIVTITANEEIQEVEGWTLSAGKTILTKEYTENGEETVEVKDLAGNKTTANVKVDNIDKVAPEVEVKYSVTTPTNENVTATITANEEIQEVEGWTLGSDKKTLTKTYSENKSEIVTITDLAGNTTTASIVVNNIDKTALKVTVKYSTVNPTNQNVTVTITSDEEIQAVAGWKLDSSKKILTKEYVENGEETVEITDLAGNKTTANVKVANIDKIAPKATIKYSTENLTNQNVIVTITADEEIKAVTGWTLGSDKKTLTKTYSENKSETVTITDLAGNTTTASIVVNNIDKTAPKVTIKYSTVNPTNQNVIVTITSDKEIQELTGWTLDKSKKILTKEYTENKEEEIEIKDLVGNTVKANIKITNIDKVKPEVKVSYSNTEQTNGKVKVEITPNEEIQIPRGWILDEEKNTIYKEYDANIEETVTIVDLAGNETNVKIKIDNIIKNSSGNNNEKNEINNNKDNTISNIAIPKAGIGMGIIIAIILLLACGIAAYKKYGKYRDIK